MTVLLGERLRKPFIKATRNRDLKVCIDTFGATDVVNKDKPY